MSAPLPHLRDPVKQRLLAARGDWTARDGRDWWCGKLPSGVLHACPPPSAAPARSTSCLRGQYDGARAGQGRAASCLSVCLSRRHLIIRAPLLSGYRYRMLRLMAAASAAHVSIDARIAHASPTRAAGSQRAATSPHTT